MIHLPPTVAPIDEPLPALRGRLWDGPDLSDVIPVEMVLADLAGIEPCSDYVSRFRQWADQTGIYLATMIDRDGQEYLMPGIPCDSQMRHRGRYLHYLFTDLDRRPDARDELGRQLIDEGHCADNRPSLGQRVGTAVAGAAA